MATFIVTLISWYGSHSPLYSILTSFSCIELRSISKLLSTWWWGMMQRKNIDNNRKTREKGCFMWEEQQLRRNKGSKRHKTTENPGMMWVKMMLETVEVAEDAINVFTDLLAVLLTISLCCCRIRSTACLQTMFMCGLCCFPSRHSGKQLLSC